MSHLVTVEEVEYMTIKVHHLRPAPGAKTEKTRVGRGEGSKGKTAGRGTKGTKARYQVPASFEGGQMPIHMRLPKLKGFKNTFKVEFQVVNLDRLAELFPRRRHGRRRRAGRAPARSARAHRSRCSAPATSAASSSTSTAHAFSGIGPGEDRSRWWLRHAAVTDCVRQSSGSDRHAG